MRDSWLEDLAAYHGMDVCNPWATADENEYDVPDAATHRLAWLRAYLAPRRHARILIMAEAAGYQGCRFSGIPITCERMLLDAHPHVRVTDVFLGNRPSGTLRTSRVVPEMNRTRAEKGYNEPTDTVVWKAILDHDLCSADVVLWNIFPYHPYRNGCPLSNRTPTEAELRVGLTWAKTICSVFTFDCILAVGRKSAQTLQAAGIDAIPLRHPANGGVGEFRRGFAEAIKKK